MTRTTARLVPAFALLTAVGCGAASGELPRASAAVTTEASSPLAPPGAPATSPAELGTAPDPDAPPPANPLARAASAMASAPVAENPLARAASSMARAPDAEDPLASPSAAPRPSEPLAERASGSTRNPLAAPPGDSTSPSAPLARHAADAPNPLAARPAAGPGRAVRFNGEELDERGWATLVLLERRAGFRLPDGDYWYDPKSGAAGIWGGPAQNVIPAGLELGGPLRADCSGGGTGRYFNGREIHTSEVAALEAALGPVPAGRYFVDAHGNAGVEGGPPVVNLYQLAAAAGGSGRGGGSWSHSSDHGGSRQHVGGSGDSFYYIDSDGTSATVGF